MVQVKNLTKKYGDRTAIDNVSFSVQKGEALGFLGPNGDGKTTVMKIITGCLCADSGSVSVAGRDILDFPIFTKSKIGYLPEIPPVYEDMYVEKYLFYTGQSKRCPPNQLKSLVNSAVNKTGLEDVRKRLIHNLSKGYRQRVGLAQALISDPDVLILDEPTVGLDPVQVIEIRKLIQDLKKNHTIILSTHILSEVEATCEKVIIINKGKVAAEGRLSELKQNMKKKTLRVRVKNPSSKLENQLQNLESVEHVQSLQDGYILSMKSELNDDVAQVIIEQKAGFLEMVEESINLEDIFVNITKSKSLGGDHS